MEHTKYSTLVFEKGNSKVYRLEREFTFRDGSSMSGDEYVMVINDKNLRSTPVKDFYIKYTDFETWVKWEINREITIINSEIEEHENLIKDLKHEVRGFIKSL